MDVKGKNAMKFASATLGCKVNQCDTRTLVNALKRLGNVNVRIDESCDICIINTCSVTAESVRKSKQTIRRVKKNAPNAIIAVCGCYAQLEPDEVKELGVDFVSGTGDREKLAEELMKYALSEINNKNKSKSKHIEANQNREKFGIEGFIEQTARSTSTEVRTTGKLENPVKSGRTRASIKVQDGCDNYCSYCVIPYARGASKSVDPVHIFDEVKELEAQGYKEIVITGIEISSFGKDLVDISLIDLIKCISAKVPNIRLRIGSLDPSMLTDDFCKELAEVTNLCNHFHISLQSGCDETLKRMGRKYTKTQVMAAMKSLRNYFQDCAISADLITGFPGETEDEFYETLEFIKKMKFSSMHIFPYSERKGTKAAVMDGSVEVGLRKERASLAAAVARENAREFLNAQIGKSSKVLIEQYKNGESSGYTTNYIQVSVPGNFKRNTIQEVKLISVNQDIMIGEV